MNEIDLFDEALARLSDTDDRWRANYQKWIRWDVDTMYWYIGRIKTQAQQGLPMAQTLLAEVIVIRLEAANGSPPRTI